MKGKLRGTLRTFSRRLGQSLRQLPGVEAAKQIARLPIFTYIRHRDRNAHCRYYLSIGAIFKDEARFLDEWIEFHLGIGVEHFYLYNNFSSDDYQAVLRPWIGRGVVTLTDWPYQAGQIPAYCDCVRRFRNETRWLALIDIDEFLFSPLAIDIRPILRRYEGQPSIFVYWHMFGSSGHVSRPAGSVIESYVRRAAGEKTDHGKSILNPRLIRQVNIHSSKLWTGRPLDEKGVTAPDTLNAGVPSWDVFRINHYWSRSIEDLKEKVGRGNASRPVPRQIDQHLAMEKTLNNVEDRLIQPLWEEIKARREQPSCPRTERE